MNDKMKKEKKTRICVIIISIVFVAGIIVRAIRGEHIGVVGMLGCIIMIIDGIYCIISYHELRKIKSNYD